jgi:predicted phosphodiesterase
MTFSEGGASLVRYAIISDIHSNLEALQSVLQQIESERIDKIFCLGDIVGYGPHPGECLALVQQHCEIIITGNHDFACIESAELYYFNQYAKTAIEWTAKQLSDQELLFLKNLPLDAKRDDIYLVHSNAIEPRTWDYILSIDDAIDNFPSFTEKICFIGHSHHPEIFLQNSAGNHSRYNYKLDPKIKIEQDNRYIINIGSVGQPRDGNPDAAFGILDLEHQVYELKRVRYNIRKTFQDMTAAGLPQFLADRLFMGR